jgi:hypothetical protein
MLESLFLLLRPGLPVLHEIVVRANLFRYIVELA